MRGSRLPRPESRDSPRGGLKQCRCYDFTMQFLKPPLVELVAELKWLAVPLPIPAGQLPNVLIPQPVIANSSQEEFFSGFARESAPSGWTASERLVPPNFPLMSLQPALRIRSFADPQMLYQIGPGLFAAHALPPYKNWDSFRPFVERGLDYLLRTRPRDERNQSFSSVSLRYLDLFTRDFVGDVPVAQFLRDSLGFKLDLPTPVQNEIEPGGQVVPQFSLRVPLRSGAVMTLTVAGEAIVGDKNGILMHTDVSDNTGVPPNRDRILAVWEDAHAVIRKIFVGLTPKLYSLMQPVEDPK